MKAEGIGMKNLITLAVVVVLALVAYNYFQTGEFTLMPGGSMSEESQEVNRLRGDFHRAAQQYRRAGRSAGLTGLDSMEDAENALKAVDGVERDLKRLRGQLKDPEVKTEIDELLQEISAWKRAIQ